MERKELVTKIKSTIVTNEHPKTEHYNDRKFIDLKLLTDVDWSKGNLDSAGED